MREKRDVKNRDEMRRDLVTSRSSVNFVASQWSPSFSLPYPYKNKNSNFLNSYWITRLNAVLFCAVATLPPSSLYACSKRMETSAWQTGGGLKFGLAKSFSGREFGFRRGRTCG